jgi:NIPSNAP protein
MLFERRAYTLRPGSEPSYWALQRQWNKPASFRPLLERNLGYFAMAAGDGERIVHLYRWDNYDDAKQRLGAIITPERMEYFVTARSFLLRQENSYLDHAPIAELSPLWNDKRDWLPNQPAFTNAGNASELAVSERVLDFLPGGLLAYWEGFRKLNAATLDAFRDRLVGVFFVTVGSLHRTFAYHWHKNWPEAEAHRRQLGEFPDWNAFMDDNRPRIVSGHVAHLRPSPVPWMRALFDPIDWTMA